MSAPVQTSTAWSVLDAKWVDHDPTCDAITVTVQANGKTYAVACSGPKHMRSNEFISAMRAAVACLIQAAGGDMSVVGAGAVGDTFDTGDQRAN
jgi:hypothetical protein